jgi:hypothetical protein
VQMRSSNRMFSTMVHQESLLSISFIKKMKWLTTRACRIWMLSHSDSQQQTSLLCNLWKAPLRKSEFRGTPGCDLVHGMSATLLSRKSNFRIQFVQSAVLHLPEINFLLNRRLRSQLSSRQWAYFLVHIPRLLVQVGDSDGAGASIGASLAFSREGAGKVRLWPQKGKSESFPRKSPRSRNSAEHQSMPPTVLSPNTFISGSKCLLITF